MKYPWLNDRVESSVPTGWIGIFYKFNDEVAKILVEEGLPYDCFTLVEVKEKYGSLRCYFNLQIDDSHNTSVYDKILDEVFKMELRTLNTCIYCGKPAEYYTRGWSVPICTECALAHGDIKLVKIHEEKN